MTCDPFGRGVIKRRPSAVKSDIGVLRRRLLDEKLLTATMDLNQQLLTICQFNNARLHIGVQAQELYRHDNKRSLATSEANHQLCTES